MTSPNPAPNTSHYPAPSLPALPLMLLRSVPTMVLRKGPQADPEDLTFSYQAPGFSNEHLAKYREMFPGLRSGVPLTYFYLLAQRAHLAAMLDPAFPWPILGMVHVANNMQQHEPVQAKQAFTLQVKIEMPERAGTRKRVRPVYKVEFWQQDTLVVECISTYQVGGGEPPARGRRREMPAPDLQAMTSSDLWYLESQLGRRYAQLSGDYNPIHIHPWLSRWFGFSRPIIHGMYSVARAQADIEKQLQQPVTKLEVQFKRPLILPAEARCYLNADEGKLMVCDPQGKRAYLEGSFAVN